ncbi:hypothetical protein [Sanyastnella coralliicola]|uniref:hypothetical protein n=1 Tax=Sanyastnella coralliicola TaxID=3069118 RepID=UPI0027B96D4D|nr:hypothetical protein [Longitalea sp. SCSIO 12813]
MKDFRFLRNWNYDEETIRSIQDDFKELESDGFSYDVVSWDVGDFLINMKLQMPPGYKQTPEGTRMLIAQMLRLDPRMNLNLDITDGENKVFVDFSDPVLPEFHMMKDNEGQTVVIRLKPPMFMGVVSNLYSVRNGLSHTFKRKGTAYRVHEFYRFDETADNRVKANLKRMAYFLSRNFETDTGNNEYRQESEAVTIDDVSPTWLSEKIMNSSMTRDEIAENTGATVADLSNFSSGAKPMSKVRRACFFWFFKSN